LLFDIYRQIPSFRLSLPSTKKQIENWKTQSETFFNRIARQINTEIRKKIFDSKEKKWDMQFISLLFSDSKNRNSSTDKLMAYCNDYEWIKGKTLQRQWIGESKEISPFLLHALLWFVDIPPVEWGKYSADTQIIIPDTFVANGVYEAFFVDSIDSNMIHRRIIHIKTDATVETDEGKKQGRAQMINGYLHIELFSKVSFGGHLFGHIGGNQEDNIQYIYCIFTGLNRNSKIVSFPELLIRTGNHSLQFQNLDTNMNSPEMLQIFKQYKGLKQFLTESSKQKIILNKNVNEKI